MQPLTVTPASASCAFDSISGQYLLGSSFGIPGLNATFDYLIVGGGTAGLALANRLTESEKYTVAVIESGSLYEIGNSNQSQIPRYVWNGAGLGFDDVNPLVDWVIRTEPELGIGGQRIHYPRGRTLGGSSARNHMVYNRATKGSYKKWADEVGDKVYEWESWSKYFDKSTTFYPPDNSKRLANSTPLDDPAGKRATSGPVRISYTNWVLPFTSWMLKATIALGMKPIPGFIDGELIGSSWNLRSVHPTTQTRESAETAYLRPALKRQNLIVYHSSTVLKILFEEKMAVGVLVDTLRKQFNLKAKIEVIISAGAFQSPQLLMVSGIGPRRILENFGIPVLVDAPGVGKGMQDHPAVSVTRKVRLVTSTVLNDPAKIEAAIESYIHNGTGPLASTGGEVVAWEKLPRRLVSNTTATALSEVPNDWPDLEYIVTSSYPGVPPDSADYAGLTTVLVNTFSQGNVSISSASALDLPVVNVAFLTDSRDQEVAIAAVKRTREILNHPSLAPIMVGSESVPGSDTETDEQILRYIQANARTISHVSCTCKMGRRGDKTAVVDSRGRVFGVQRLRVIDASVMPFLPPGHPMATVYALAELLAEDICQGRGAN
ncbi:putative glucose-methanol-choline oxidoreductase [Lojkania enalia]|uniref:Glucose-methanol-choline oxidoreductase n=1 Tax=Lojkania enalia TaxID=147567 RepID=A0A9P4N322_9PLEO|nr:putative glucose-methanol-choline oxidoreductase [Didymosphaeria enalia]